MTDAVRISRPTDEQKQKCPYCFGTGDNRYAMKDLLAGMGIHPCIPCYGTGDRSKAVAAIGEIFE
jgi:hypothetical protein